ncbi:metallophosphoesterase family protein [Desulfosoma caldarium]|uniref:DNA repair exonuclease SbcCD nuclease subunit n=1 Tax=Desulfosoma caldarium TaxID=610254 RepID=A0A3N1VKL1_9BACT|nr:metallophosphoesterase [Desulfosoma caldarium]ROR03344.1 DNA repair exonuclease SbcCD nuclease subunit [Desulfosoma caldarium]
MGNEPWIVDAEQTVTLATVTGFSGLLFIGDPHVAAYPPGHRTDDYRSAVLGKLAHCLREARERRLLPVILGDLFHVPRDNPNGLLVKLMELFRPTSPWVLVGNHDKYEARLTQDVSLAVLRAAQVLVLLDRAGPVAWLQLDNTRVLLGASPDWTPIPSAVQANEVDKVVWITHHNVRFPDYEAGRIALREIPGVDLVVNGHIHTPKPPQRRGQTLWVNPGSLTRITRSAVTRNLRPAVALWTPRHEEPVRLEVPHAPFDDIFPSLDTPLNPEGEVLDASRFIQGLENLALRKTTEGVGLKAFLEANLDPSDPVTPIIWTLYEEVIGRVNKA